MITAVRSLHAIGIIVKETRCCKCNKKLADADYLHLVIKCPRCGVMNHLKATEPPTRVQKAPSQEELHNGRNDL